MAGFQQRKVFCQGLTRKSKRPCRAKGYPTANGKYLCRFHGGNNIKGFNQKNYTDDTRIKALSKLKQFKNKPREEVEQYYYKEVKPRIGTTERSRYYRKYAYARRNSFRNFRGQKTLCLTDELTKVLCNLKERQRTQSQNN